MKIDVLVVDGKFSQRENYNTTLDKDDFERELREVGLDARFIELDWALSASLDDFSEFVVVGGHPNPDVHAVLLDLAITLERRHLAPALEFIAAYENKGLQSILAKRKNLEYLKQDYKYKNYIEANYPVVFKTVSGAGSSGVKLLRKNRNFSWAYFSFIFRSSSFSALYDFFKFSAIRNLMFRHPMAESRYQIKRPYLRHVIQEFAPGLNCDYKILVFGDHYFTLKRAVRDGDFRASGSGKFIAEPPSDDLLCFAKDCFQRLDVPYVSLDVVESDLGYRLIEFQSVHFGPITQMKAEYCYVDGVDGWERKINNCSLEYCYARALSLYVSRKV